MLFENISPLPKLQLPLFYGAFNQEAKSCGLLGSYRITFASNRSAQKSGWEQRGANRNEAEVNAILQHINELQNRAFTDQETLEQFCASGSPLKLPDSFGNKAFGYITRTNHSTLFCRLMPEHNAYSAEILCYDTHTLQQHLAFLENAMQQSHAIRFYYPVSAEYFPLLDSEFGDNERAEYPVSFDGEDLAEYSDAIHKAIRKDCLEEETVRGLFAFYDKDDSLWNKIVSAKPAVEVINGKLWGVAECQVVGELTDNEIACFKDYWSGQMSDGWGEGFEQRGIDSGLQHIGELYVHFWQSRDWEMLTEEEFPQSQQQGQQMV